MIIESLRRGEADFPGWGSGMECRWCKQPDVEYKDGVAICRSCQKAQARDAYPAYGSLMARYADATFIWDQA